MPLPDPSSLTYEQLADPNIDQTTLAQLAAARPDLWPAIMAHPNCYPELTAWIWQQTPVSTPSNVSTPQPASQSSALSSPVFTGQQSGYQSSQQVAETLKRLWRQVIASPFMWLPAALAVVAFFAFISVFMPVVTTTVGVSAGWFSPQIGGSEGANLLVFTLIVLVCAGLAIWRRTRWSRLTAGIAAFVVSIFGMYDGFGSISNINQDTMGGLRSPGGGLYLLGIMSLLMLLISISLIAIDVLTRYLAKRSQPAVPPSPWPPASAPTSIN